MRLCHSRGRATVVLAAVSLLTLSACAGGDAASSDNGAATGSGTAADAGQDAAASAERLRVGILSEEGNLTPFTYETGTPGLNLTMLSYDSLMQIDTEGAPQPWLASSVEADEEGTTYTVQLVDSATWHDGEAVDAEDVAFSIDYYQNGPPGRFQTALRLVESVTVEDEHTLTLTLSEISPSFELRTLADVPILPQHIWEGIEDPDTAPFSEDTSVGSGPYRLVDSKPGTSYTFEANPDYFRGAPKVQELVVIRFADDAGAIAALRSGSGLRARIAHALTPHSHDHTEAIQTAEESSRDGIRAAWIGLAGMGATALMQIVIVAISGSIALLADTLHNVGHLATTIPLIIAFKLGQRPATRRYSFGFRRAEDLVGLLIAMVIALSAALIVWESVRALTNPRPLTNLGWVGGPRK